MLAGAVLLGLVAGALGQAVLAPPSPCPDVFEYVAAGRRYEGVVRAPAPEPGGTLRVTVKMFTTALLDSESAGRLMLADDELSSQDTVVFRLQFPSQDPLTTIGEIVVDGVSICQGPEVQAQSRTTSTVRFTLLNYSPRGARPPARPPAQTQTSRRPATTPRPKQRPTDASQGNGVAEDCGIADISQHLPLIAFGTPTERGEWPWLAAIFTQEGEAFCGGSLVDMRHVITAAHCLQRPGGKLTRKDEIFVVLGKHKLDSSNETGNQVRVVSNVIIHPSYNPNSYVNDIALLELQSPATYTHLVRPICLWRNDFSEEALVSREAAVVGWGRDEKGNMRTEYPEMAKVPIVSLATCRRSEVALEKITSEMTLCAGYKNGTGPCTGDSGGGLMLPNDEDAGAIVRYYLQGVVSIALKKRGSSRNCDLNHYVVYTNVNKYLAWLRGFVVDTYGLD